MLRRHPGTLLLTRGGSNSHRQEYRRLPGLAACEGGTDAADPGGSPGGAIT